MAVPAQIIPQQKGCLGYMLKLPFRQVYCHREIMGILSVHQNTIWTIAKKFLHQFPVEKQKAK